MGIKTKGCVGKTVKSYKKLELTLRKVRHILGTEEGKSIILRAKYIMRQRLEMAKKTIMFDKGMNKYDLNILEKRRRAILGRME